MVKKKRRRLKILPTVLAAFFITFLICSGIVLAMVISIANELPQWNAEDFANAQTSFLYDKDGKLYANLYIEDRTTVTLDQVPDFFIDTILASEDTRFYKHFGIDVVRIFGALKYDILHMSTGQGASTITMQLARNAILENQDKKLERKIKEALLAIQIEKNYSKDEILYYYINEIYLGPRVYGIQAACQYYFGKDVEEVTLGEAAMIVGVFRNASYYSPYKNYDRAVGVRDRVLDALVKYKPEYKEQVEAAKLETLVVAEEAPSKDTSYNHPWFTDYVIDETEDILASLGLERGLVYNGGLRIYTTIDTNVQSAMEAAYANPDNFPKSNSANPIQSAMVVMDPHTGQVRGLIGGREYLTKRGLNRATGMKRQPGSSFKPVVVYGPAVENGYGTGSVMDDCPTTFGKSYSPSNQDGSWSGLVTMRAAVAKSMNMPAVKFLQAIGVDTGYDFATNLGIELDSKNDRGLSIGLGGLTQGISPLALANAYCAFDNEGVFIENHVITKIEDAKGQVIYTANPERRDAMSPETAYMVTSMLQTVVESGTGTNARMNRPVAAKTGTTQLPDSFGNIKGNKDAWFAAYTPELVGVVWMGYDADFDENNNPQYLRQVYGGKYPAQLWKKVMTESLKNVKVSAFPRPSGVVSVEIDTKSGLLPSTITPKEYIKAELFKAGTVPKEYSTAWKLVEIDPESGKIASPFCPQRVQKAYLKRPTDKTVSSRVKDYALYEPTVTCPLHSTATGETVTVYICTDPAHNGQYYLANVPDSLHKGGCPSQYVQQKTFGAQYVPNQYCPLTNHQYTGGTQQPTNPPAGNENTNNDTNSNQNNNQNNNNPPVTDDGDLIKPVSLNAKLNGDNTAIVISWTDNYNEPTTLYQIEKTDTTTGKTSILKTYFKSITDGSISGGTTYSYRIRAFDEVNTLYSGWTSAVSVTVP